MLALISANHQPNRSFAPTLRLTAELLERLAIRGVIELPWPDKRWLTASQGKHTLPFELLDWRYCWAAYPEAGLAELLEEQLKEHDWRVDCPESRFELWSELCFAEIENYAAYQLEKHQMDPEWAFDIEWMRRQVGRRSLARWKYIVWAGVRRGTQEKAKVGATNLSIRQAIRTEYIRRQDFVQGDSTFGAFVPNQKRPFSVLCEILVLCVLPIGDSYWTVVPSDWAESMMVSPGVV
ncbi:hypothetical protein [Pseudomarimonas arenosa]|uniref:Uncharacterized protein n=1 Tax=Pseudomarimonas arenosa TaxID=2774145 RepID=A0AAW3ZH19_9GAMM|nr:hypothetical protein [Pseudomarimonas arenosa]MBD8524427.1 hypothetical protein [Pseudomarimonas arenosa]